MINERRVAVAFLAILLGDCSIMPKAQPAPASASSTTARLSRQKSASVNRVLTALPRLALIARFNRNPSNLEERTSRNVRMEVRRLKQINELLTLALMCRAVVLISSDVASLQYDRVFDEAFWYCVNLLSQQTSDEAVEALQDLRQYANTDAGHTRLLDEAIEDQRAKRGRRGKG